MNTNIATITKTGDEWVIQSAGKGAYGTTAIQFTVRNAAGQVLAMSVLEVNIRSNNAITSPMVVSGKEHTLVLREDAPSGPGVPTTMASWVLPTAGVLPMTSGPAITIPTM